MNTQARPSTTIMDSRVFKKDDLCEISKEYALGSKVIKDKRDLIKESRNIHDMKDTSTLSSMRSEMDETRVQINKHVSSVMLQSLMKLDEEHERRTAAEFTKLLSESDKGTLIKLMNIAPMEFKVLELYKESKDFNYIDEKLGWSTGASFKTYITLSYKIKRFFNKEFKHIYEDFLEGKSEHEVKTINRLHNFRKKCIEEDLFKPRDIKVPRIIDGKKKLIKVKEEEMITVMKIVDGDSCNNVSEEFGWSKRSAERYYAKGYETFANIEEGPIQIVFEDTLNEKELKVYKLLDEKEKHIAEKLGVTIRTVQNIKKRIKEKNTKESCRTLLPD